MTGPVWRERKRLRGCRQGSLLCMLCCATRRLVAAPLLMVPCCGKLSLGIQWGNLHCQVLQTRLHDVDHSWHGRYLIKPGHADGQWAPVSIVMSGHTCFDRRTATCITATSALSSTKWKCCPAGKKPALAFNVTLQPAMLVYVTG